MTPSKTKAIKFTTAQRKKIKKHIYAKQNPPDTVV